MMTSDVGTLIDPGQEGLIDLRRITDQGVMHKAMRRGLNPLNDAGMGHGSIESKGYHDVYGRPIVDGSNRQPHHQKRVFILKGDLRLLDHDLGIGLAC